MAIIDAISQRFSRGAKIIKENPQILYTIFLLITIPLAFLYSGQRFLHVSSTNQERIEKERIGLFQDTFSDFAAYHFNDHEFLQRRIEKVAAENPSIISIRILKNNSDGAQIIASKDPSEIGKIDQARDTFYKQVGLPQENSVIVPTIAHNERHWEALRLIKDPLGDTLGILLTDFSMAHIDQAASKNIQSAFGILFIIIFAIFILLIAHARMLDYVTLYKKIKEADKMKDDFISIASHELRAPLTAIKWQADAMVEIEKSESEGARNIQEAAVQLERLVEDMLNVSRIEQGRMKFDLKKADTSDILKNVVEFLRPTAEQKGLKVIYEHKPLPFIVVDTARLSQVITNLVNNSIKYTKQGEIRIETKKEDGFLNISIHDTGIGISAENQRKLFQKFARIKTGETRGIRGTGLGLWITKQIVENMKGTISVESIKGTGSSFTIRFPLLKT